MQKFLKLLLPAALVLGSYGMAEAAQTRSFVKTIDADSQAFRLKNGLTFYYGDDFDASQLRSGTQVKVKYSKQGNRKIVDSVRIYSQPDAE